jgi:hypothetical protein
LYFEGSLPAEDPQGVMQRGRSHYIVMFPWKDFLMGRIRKIQKHKERRKGTDQENFKKTRRKEWMKKKEKIFIYMEVPILMCSPSVGNTFGLLTSCYTPS